MKRSGLLFLLGLVAVLGPFDTVGLRAQPAGEIEIIFDASRSMNEATGGVTKLDAAKQALTTIANQITAGSLVGLRVFGKNPVQGTVQQACLDSELTIPISPFQKDRMIGQVLSLQASGQTLIGYSLELATRDFSNLTGAPKTIILISDGEESCGRDPIQIAQSLKAQGINLVIHVVGFDLEPEAAAQLRQLAEMTGGAYADARNAGELTAKLTAVAQETGLLLKPEKSGGENLLSASEGTRIIYSSSAEFAKLIDGREEKTGALYNGQEVVFSFKDNQPVLLEKFFVPIFQQYSHNPGRLELWGSLESPDQGSFPILAIQVKNQVAFGDIYQEFPIDPPAALRYLKVKVGKNAGGDVNSYHTEWRASGKYLTPEEFSKHLQEAGKKEMNLLAVANGGQLIASSEPDYQYLIDGALGDAGRTANVKINSEAIFGFRGGKTALLKKAAIPIFKASGYNVKTVEFSASLTSPTSGFVPIGTFETANLLFAGNPYQEYVFPAPVKAKFLKVKVLASHGESYVQFHELESVGNLE